MNNQLLKKGLLIVLITFFSLGFTSHKFYLSLSQIEYIKDKKSIQIIINVFMDDIELAINELNQIDLQLTTKKELPKNDNYFKKYLANHFQISIDGKKQECKYIGKEYEGDLVYFYLEITGIESITNLEVKNTILVQHFEDQQNLIKAKINNIHRSKLLSKKTNKALLNF